jgi:hypothetical protein
MPKPVDKRKTERADDAEVWADDERKALLKLGSLFEKWNKRAGTVEPEKKKKGFLEELGILS